MATGKKEKKYDPDNEGQMKEEKVAWQPGHGARVSDQGGPHSQGKEKQGRQEKESRDRSKAK